MKAELIGSYSSKLVKIASCGGAYQVSVAPRDLSEAVWCTAQR